MYAVPLFSVNQGIIVCIIWLVVLYFFKLCTFSLKYHHFKPLIKDGNISSERKKHSDE